MEWNGNNVARHERLDTASIKFTSISGIELTASSFVGFVWRFKRPRAHPSAGSTSIFDQ